MTNILNNERWHSREWIENVSNLLENKTRQIQKEHWKKENSRVSHKINAKRFEQSEKGKKGAKKCLKLRRERLKKFILSKEKKEQIRVFIRGCPEGYEVDHIIPVSRGGPHCLSNLQYLSRSQNKLKGAFNFYKNCAYAQCFIDRTLYTKSDSTILE